MDCLPHFGVPVKQEAGHVGAFFDRALIILQRAVVA